VTQSIRMRFSVHTTADPRRTAQAWHRCRTDHRAKYMVRRRQSASQGWKTFLHNHTDGIASMDLFVVPTISFRLLYGFLILQHSRRELLWLGEPRIQRPSGLRSRSLRHLAGGMRRDTWSVIGTVFTAPGSFSACGRWAFGI